MEIKRWVLGVLVILLCATPAFGHRLRGYANFEWTPVEDENVAGYRLYYKTTDAVQWTHRDYPLGPIYPPEECESELNTGKECVKVTIGKLNQFRTYQFAAVAFDFENEESAQWTPEIVGTPSVRFFAVPDLPGIDRTDDVSP